MNRGIYILCAIVIGVFIAVGCGSSGGGNGEEPVQVSEVTGTISLPSDATGKCMAVVLDSDANPDNDNDVDGTARNVSGSTISYAFMNVPDGMYYVLAVVDMDMSGGSNCADFTDYDFFSTGDYGGYFGGTDLNPPVNANVPVPHDEGLTYDFSLTIYTDSVTSPDNWELRSSGTNLNLKAVHYDNNTFVAVGYGGMILTSSEGMIWTERYTGTNIDLRGVAYGKGMFLVVGFDGKYLTSTDNVTWVLRGIGTSNDFLYDVTYGNNSFVAVGVYYDALFFPHRTIFISADGLTWTEKTSPVSTRFNLKVTYGNNIFIILGSKSTIFTSPDGNVWTARSSGTGNGLNGITYGNNIFVIAGEGGTILTSPDGESWTAKSSGTGIDLEGVTFGNGTFVSVGKSGTILTSPDGDVWTAGDSGTSADLECVTYGNGTFVTVGVDGIILQSN